MPASQPAIRPGCTRYTTPEFLHIKRNHIGFNKTVVPKNVYPLYHVVSFYPLLGRFIFKSLTKTCLHNKAAVAWA